MLRGYLLIVFAHFSVHCFVLDGSTPAPLSTCRANKTITNVSESCIDAGDVNCRQADEYFHVCCDVHHAKVVCRRYCQLCDIVDGGWSSWSNWSKCDVSCGQGSINRLRTCSNPTPAKGGLNCTGSNQEIQRCSLNPCPVDGGWGVWSSWGTCSVTCGVGIERRDRTCNNPAPQYSGNHCFGDSHEDRICYSKHCTDGAWSAWTSWGCCSKTSGIGIRTRERYCNNPAPSILGSYCLGTSMQSDTCEHQEIVRQEIRYHGSCCTQFVDKQGITIYLCDGCGRNVCSSYEGRLEYHDTARSEWRTVCRDGWDNIAANVVCRSIGYNTGKTIQTSVAGTTERIDYSHFHCDGRESTIFACNYDTFTSGCTHNNDVTLKCE